MIILFHFRSEHEFHTDSLCRKHVVSALESVRQILPTVERESESLYQLHCQTFRRKTLILS